MWRCSATTTTTSVDHETLRFARPAARVFSTPLGRRFPALAELPRTVLAVHPTPVQAVRLSEGETLWVKRDDDAGRALGGNKVRALEFLLAAAGREHEVVTVGGLGSTHALATAVYARRLGAEATVIRWPQEMNPQARRVAATIDEIATRRIEAGSVVEAYLRAALLRLRRRTYWVPAGGSSPLGVLGHVNAALELLEQVDAGLLPRPARVVVPLGTGGTAAGLVLGFAAARAEIEVVGVRVVPRIVANRGHVLRLVRRASRLIARYTGERVSLARARFRISHEHYGGAYGRETAAGRAALERFAPEGIGLDATYSAKACVAALEEARDSRALFWVTFDGRWLTHADAR